MSCCRHVTIPHLILSQLAGERRGGGGGGEGGGSESLAVTATPLSLSYLSSVFSPSLCFIGVYFLSLSHSPSPVVSQVYYVNIRCWTAPASLAAFPTLLVIPTRMNTV